MKVVLLLAFVAPYLVQCAIKSRVITEDSHEEKPEFGEELNKLT